MSETLPSDELVQKARGLGLPDHFYNYLELKENESDNDERFPWEKSDSSSPSEKGEPEKSKEEPKTNIPKPVFGASSGGSFNFGAKRWYLFLLLYKRKF